MPTQAGEALAKEEADLLLLAVAVGAQIVVVVVAVVCVVVHLVAAMVVPHAIVASKYYGLVAAE